MFDRRIELFLSRYRCNSYFIDLRHSYDYNLDSSKELLPPVGRYERRIWPRGHKQPSVSIPALTASGLHSSMASRVTAKPSKLRPGRSPSL